MKKNRFCFRFLFGFLNYNSGISSDDVESGFSPMISFNSLDLNIFFLFASRRVQLEVSHCLKIQENLLKHF